MQRSGNDTIKYIIKVSKGASKLYFVDKHFELGQVPKMLKEWSIFCSDSHLV